MTQQKKLSQASPPWLSAVESFQTLYTGHLQARNESCRAQDARVRVSSTDVLFADSVHWEKRERFLVTFCRLAKSYPLAAGQRKHLI